MSQQDLTQGPVTLSLFRLTAPMMMGVSSNILVSMLEIGFIGQLGTQEVAAIKFTFPLIMMLSGVVIATVALYLAVVPWSYGLWGTLMMSSASLNALGKLIPSTALPFTRVFLIYVPLALLLNHYFGYLGIFVATAVSNTLMGFLGSLWLQQRFFPRP